MMSGAGVRRGMPDGREPELNETGQSMTEQRLMKRRDVLLSIIAAGTARAEFGRTSLQKVAYFVGVHRKTGFRHQAHFYGPFSEVVEADVEALVSTGLIEERVQNLPFVGNRGHQAKRFEYRLTDEGQRRITELEVVHTGEYSDIQAFVRRLEEAAGGLDQGILSPAAKTFFIAQRENRDLTPKEIHDLARDLGWDLKPAQIKKVAQVLQQLNLVEVDTNKAG
jgi:uncharacterized protein YwgA